MLNHWNQQVVLLKQYYPAHGARGLVLDLEQLNYPSTKNINSSNESGTFLSGMKLMKWSRFQLELEIKEGKWQMIQVSPSFLSKELLTSLPPSMPTALWEMIYLSLLDDEQDKEVLQTLLDTGISPRQGYIAYIRLIHRILFRAKEVNNLSSTFTQLTDLKVTN